MDKSSNQIKQERKASTHSIRSKESNTNDKSKSHNLDIYLGTYTGKIIINSLSINNKDSNKIVQSPSSFKSSETMIKTVVPLEKNFIFTSGTDEIIRIYNIKNYEEKGMIVSYSGSVNKLVVQKNTIFAMCDNNIEIFKLKTFNKINTLKGHKNPINSFIVHSSGKLLFTIGRDNYLMLWNLNSYKCSFRYKFPGLELLSLNWVLKESFIVVGSVNKVVVLDYLKDSSDVETWKVVDHKIRTSFDNPGKVLDVKIYKDRYIFVFKTNFNVEIIKLNFDSVKNTEDEDSKINIKNSEVRYCSFNKNSNNSNSNNDSNNNNTKVDTLRVKFADICYNEDIKKSYIVIVTSDNTIKVYDTVQLIKSLFTKEQEDDVEVFVDCLKEVNLLTDRFTSLSVNLHE